ncbi:hypothetical protein TBLA_0A02650 [Henningerozyma blattae CBS 6284]|uniref:RRM domain-containing protein n=1 Tax=Henningerozyma blattae (strain ATCC 34711 / CBS 6284 / DSM 70876 / NBRC 10599 / NRRL Y-10934 / UCD 77-7) TaxID=1071380 RepID=I2GVB2_HENB6|nr:hypothetical protein TBLA_0A02650 [Tetrapisispora blattae CBS 6284]CCH58064.1 hypothetical protein TBLA_0A02650 [Tetrapisispora blattae CBS 6284]
MSAILDKSLDEIIGNNKRQAKNNSRRNNNGPRRTTKSFGHSRREHTGPSNRQQPVKRGPVNAAVRVAQLLNRSNRDAKVSVEGLPRDINQDAVKEFFASQVGGVQRVLLSYNERGNSTGMATITFRNGDAADRAVKKFNGAPIDGGRSKLKLNLIIDPNQQPTKSLSDRIKAVPRQQNMRQQVQNRSRQGRPQRNDRQQGPQGQQGRGPNKRVAMVKNRAPRQKREKPVKKSLEDLDKEMAEYFDEKK